MKITAWILPVLSACAAEPAATFPLPAHRAVLELFVMSQCQYGVEVVNAVAPVVKDLGGAVDVRVHYIGEGGVGAFTSLHGPSEIRGDIAQLCVAEHAPERLFDVLVCQNEDMAAVDTNWRACVTRHGAALAAIEACVDGEEGQELLAASFALARVREAQSSPTIFLDGQPYTGRRKTTDLLRAVCSTFGGEVPPPCAAIPAAPKVEAIFLTDTRCTDESCDITPLEPKLRAQLAGLEVKRLDLAEPEGKALYAELRAADPSFRLLPVALLSNDVVKDVDGHRVIRPFLTPLGEWQSLNVGAQFDPTAEICNNAADDDGNGLVDCLDDRCARSLVCRAEVPRKLDLFAMSHCPYGAKAMVAVNTLVQQYGDEVDVDVHFIGTEANGKLGSIHGEAEVDEDVRQICAANRYPADAQHLRFLACRSRDFTTPDWQSCATEAGMDPAVIQSCFDHEGQDLLRASFEEARVLSVTSSPTFLSNNKRLFDAGDVGTIARQLCQDNPGSKLCSAAIPDVAAPAAPGTCE